MGKIPLQRLLVPAAAAIALAAAFYALTAPQAPGGTGVQPAISAGLGFLSGVNVTADTLDAGEQAIPAEEKYENLSELALYRKTDVMLDLHFIGREFKDAGTLRPRVQEADGFLEGLAGRWQEGSVDYAYFDAGGEEGDYAFDLYCMIALETGNGMMAEKIRSALKEEGWSTAQAQEFRVIIDESWCIMMLADFGTANASIMPLLQAKARQLSAYETRPFAGDRAVEEIRRSYARSHVLMLKGFLEDRGIHCAVKDKICFPEYKRYLQDKLYDDGIANLGSADYLSNSLYFLAKTGYAKQRLRPLAEALLKLQKADGGWSSMFSPEMFRGLLTARAVLALNAYENAGG